MTYNNVKHIHLYTQNTSTLPKIFLKRQNTNTLPFSIQQSTKCFYVWFLILVTDI